MSADGSGASWARTGHGKAASAITDAVARSMVFIAISSPGWPVYADLIVMRKAYAQKIFTDKRVNKILGNLLFRACGSHRKVLRQVSLQGLNELCGAAQALAKPVVRCVVNAL
ncbi:hypothetical protein GCM10011367_22860 [Marinicauda pacifica]|nr:hypothetical protein GCM10011367_22860 [Marinicauda pacifica]